MGLVGSGLVAMNRAPRSISLMARVMFSKERLGFAQHHVVRATLGQDKPDIMQGRCEPDISEHVGSGARSLIG